MRGKENNRVLRWNKSFNSTPIRWFYLDFKAIFVCLSGSLMCEGPFLVLCLFLLKVTWINWIQNNGKKRNPAVMDCGEIINSSWKQFPPNMSLDRFTVSLKFPIVPKLWNKKLICCFWAADAAEVNHNDGVHHRVMTCLFWFWHILHKSARKNVKKPNNNNHFGNYNRLKRW